jgi:hypothetical protein
MRATLFLFLGFIILGLFLWVTLNGVFLFIAGMIGLALVVITIGYPETMLLFLLGARELRSSDEKSFFEAAAQESYKLSVPMPRLYFYNGSLDRAFVFQARHNVSIVLNKNLLERATKEELKAICFELLLQVKKGMSTKRTKCMFVLGLSTWIIHSLSGLLTNLIPFKDIRKGSKWFTNYLFNPVLDFVYRIMMSESYFRKLEQFIGEYPEEKALLGRVGLKLRKPYSYYSLPSRKLLELHSVGRSRHYQNIMALEFLPHEWDYLFRTLEIKGAE